MQLFPPGGVASPLLRLGGGAFALSLLCLLSLWVVLPSSRPPCVMLFSSPQWKGESTTTQTRGESTPRTKHHHPKGGGERQHHHPRGEGSSTPKEKGGTQHRPKEEEENSTTQKEEGKAVPPKEGYVLPAFGLVLPSSCFLFYHSRLCCFPPLFRCCFLLLLLHSAGSACHLHSFKGGPA